jgi:Type IV secretion-system coupling protein DNA-binding domain
MKPRLLAFALPLLGAGIAWMLPSPFHWVSFWSGAALGVLTLLKKPRRVILRFGSLTWTRQEICRHVLITGDTGAGKTTSGFHPILVQLTKSEPSWGGLVLGVKGDEHRFISELLSAHGRSQDLIHLQVRPESESTHWQPPHRYNLLSDRSLPWMTHAKAIVDIASSMTDGHQSAFFRPMAQIALAQAFELLDALQLPVTLTRAYELLTSQDSATQALKALKRNSSGKHEKLVEFFESTFVNAKAYEQREAVEGTIKTYLGFFLDPDVANVFSSNEPNTFSLNEIDQGAVITITMPQRLVSERRYIQTYLKILFYFHALRRYDKAPALRKGENLLLLVADEFQDLVTASEDGISDHKIVDRIRGAGAAIIAGMQSELSADPVIGSTKREVLTLNMRTRFIFRSADIKGATESANFLGKREIWKKTHSSRPMQTATISRRKDEDYFIKPAKLMRLRDHTAIIAHPSKRFVNIRLKPIDGNGKVYSWY